jgi:hypothetical protein
MKLLPPLLLITAFLLAPAIACAETMTCGSWVVSPETTVADLLKKCGPPTSKEVSTEDVRARGPAGSIKVGETITEKWIYDRGSLSFTMVVTIVDGEVKSIESRH